MMQRNNCKAAMPRLFVGVIFFAMTFLAATNVAFSQRYLGSIQGQVTDSTGAAGVDADVVAEEVATHYKTLGKTNSSGAYAFPSLNPGTYVVTITVASFKTES